MPADCPSDQQLLDFCLGNCNVEMLDRVAEHLEACQLCEQRLQQLEEVPDGLLDRLAKEAPSAIAANIQELDQLLANVERNMPLQGSFVDVEEDADHQLSSTIDLGSDTHDGKKRPPTPPIAFDLPPIPNYEFLEFLGRGGMGVVVKARQVNLHREVAIKFPKRLPDEGDSDRFLREARAAGRLRHPHICPIYEVGECEGRPYLVMAYIQGGTLRAWSRQEHTMRESAEMVACLAHGVEFAHQQNVIHRDLKPDNVLVDAHNGMPVLTDFGLAKELDVQADAMTQTGQVMGTAAYMAPEQAAGRTSEVGRLSDVYSLGAILYELLCKKPPFTGPLGEVLRQVQTEEPTAPRRLTPSIHRDMETICLKALSKSPSARYASAGEMAEDLERFSRGESIVARRESLARRTIRHLKRQRQLYAISAILLIVAAMVVSFFGRTSILSTRKALVADLQRQLNDGVNLPPDQWRGNHIESLRSLNSQLDAIDPESRSQRQTDLEDSLARAIYLSFNESARIEPADEARIRNLLTILQEAAPTRAQELEAGLERRLQRPELVFELTRPVLPGDPSYQLEKHACRGNVELIAQFGAEWSKTSRVGLILNAGTRQQYEFLLSTLSELDAHQTSLTFDQSSGRGEPARLLIQRREGSSTVVLRDVAVDLAELRGKPLRMKAAREGQRLSLWVAQLEPVEFEDLFPANPTDHGVFSLVWSQPVPLLSVRAYRQTRPAASSPLLTGDLAFVDGDFDTALAEYRRQQVSADLDIRREVMFKQGLCHLHLKDPDSARNLFDSTISQRRSGDDSWAIRAACQLWLLELKLDNQDAAGKRFSQLRAMRQGLTFAALASLIPASDRSEILSRYGTTEDWLFFSPRTVENIERVRDVYQLLDTGESLQSAITAQLVKAYHMDGREEDARRLCEEALEHFHEMLQQHHGFAMVFLEQYGWLMHNQGEESCRQALQMIDRFMLDKQGDVRTPGWHWLLVERARLHAALGELEQADKDLQMFYSYRVFENDEYHVYLSAGLLHGFVKEAQGFPQEGVKVWKDTLLSEGYENKAIGSSFAPLVSRSIMAALTDQVTDREMDYLIDWLLGVVPRGSKLYLGLAMARWPISPVKSILRPVAQQMWQSETAREIARRVAFRTFSYRDYLYEPIYLGGLSLLQQKVFGGVASPLQQELCLTLMRDAHAAIAQDRRLRDHMQTIGELVLVNPSISTWDAIRPEFSDYPEIQAAISYLCGKRCQGRGMSEEAQAFFMAALETAPADSLAHQLTVAEVPE
ncbi:serine/threonine protein kinase [Lignipirellula cremea]|uniref:Serine/threonine-protein kinase PknB n=1 Tax=Lignipirellula cremea TaxID=2528010 RepID=A0A518DWE0_9BACT|nr:serine/threonine-protein kinase [Lignipirellula cremea]QDU96148.1 Serine/threonine-protein kinase PknB [Lignipirellula cremea]